MHANEVTVEAAASTLAFVIDLGEKTVPGAFAVHAASCFLHGV